MTTVHNLPKKQIFVSYSRKDERWWNALEPMLKRLRDHFQVTYWADKFLESGDEWERVISGRLDTSTHAILLVSPTFLSSKFVKKTELPRFKRAVKEKGVRILPIYVEPCPRRMTKHISRFQAVNSSQRALSEFPGDQDVVFEQLAREIAGYDIFLAVQMSSVHSYSCDILRDLARRMVTTLNDSGVEAVYCASARREGDKFSTPLIALDSKEALSLSKTFVMVYDSAEPSSVLVEAGFALRQRTPSVYFHRAGIDLPYMLRTSDGSTPVDIVKYHSYEEIITYLAKHATRYVPL